MSKPEVLLLGELEQFVPSIPYSITHRPHLYSTPFPTQLPVHDQLTSPPLVLTKNGTPSPVLPP
jgi:hypothetical protein